MTDCHAEPHRIVDVHDMNVELIWIFPMSVNSSCRRREGVQYDGW